MGKSRSITGEKAMIAALRRRLPTADSFKFGIRVGIGDDGAILDPPRGHSIVVTTDFSLETIHFRREWHSPESVGHRCLARGLSDLAAMGANPLAAFLSLALPAELIKGNPSWRDRFLDGFLVLAKRFRIPLAGGDTAQSPSLAANKRTNGLALADIIAIGSVPPGRALLRSGAKPGDRIYVTGFLGGAAAELRQLEANLRKFRNCKSGPTENPNPHPHLFPEPRINVGEWLSKNRKATAAIDLSDGLSTDLNHICEESQLAATIDAAAIPVHPLAKKTDSSGPLQLALHGGEDYELLFTVSPNLRIPRIISGVPIAPIGTMRRHTARLPRILLIDEKSQKSALKPDR